MQIETSSKASGAPLGVGDQLRAGSHAPLAPSAALLVSFTVPGRLRGKGRGRAGIRRMKNGQQFVKVYSDKDTVNAEAMVRQIGADAMAGRPPFEGPLFLDVLMFRNTTASWPKKRRAEARWVTGAPDCTNICKLVEDALNGIIWGDDSQICKISFERRYDDTRGECAEISVSAPPQVQTPAPRPSERAPSLFEVGA